MKFVDAVLEYDFAADLANFAALVASYPVMNQVGGAGWPLEPHSGDR